jgi:transposase
MQVETLDTPVRDYIRELEAGYRQQLRELQYKYLEIKERYDLLVYRRFVRSAEQLQADKNQPPLFSAEARETEAPEIPGPEECSPVRPHTRKRPGRRPLDPNLPREKRTVDIPESEKTCACGARLTKIGEETSEKLHIIAPRIYVEEIIRPKYACRCCEGTGDEDMPSVRIAPVEPAIIPKGITTPDLLG